MLIEIKSKLKEWVLKHAEGPHAKAFLGLNAFTEAIFFPIPPDLLLMAILMTGARRWVYYSLLTTITSVAGGIVGYVIGLFLFDTVGEVIIATFNLGEHFNTISGWYDRYAFLTVFISGFTPIPYKVFTIAGGVFKVNILIFIIASFVGRGARYFLIGYIFGKYGKTFGKLIYRYLNILSVVLVLVLIILFFIFI